MKSLPGAVQGLLVFSWCCCGCSGQGSAFGASSSPQLEAGTHRRCWWIHFPVWPGSLPSEHFPCQPHGVTSPWGPNGVTASCCAGGTSSLGHFPVLEPWRDYFRNVSLVLLWPHLRGVTESWRLEKPSKITESNPHLNPTLATKPSSAPSAWHLSPSRGGEERKGIIE